LRLTFTFIIIYFLCTSTFAQIIVSGTVLDNGKINFVEGVTVMTTGGKPCFTDSLGKYSISTKNGDSLYFIYNNKPTQKFAVNKIPNAGQFDISLHISVKSKYSVLKEVVVYAKNYKQDSLENRENYGEVFSYRKNGIGTSITPGGGVGLDANELINMFRFRRNKRLKAFQERLEADEKEKYVTYRFNKVFVRRITQLKDEALDTFLLWYRPSYEFTSNSSEIEFNQYVLNASYHFRKMYPSLVSEVMVPDVQKKKEK
jgi:hypothetical protein